MVEWEETQLSFEIKSFEDPVMLNDKRVLENMLNDDTIDDKNDYCNTVTIYRHI